MSETLESMAIDVDQRQLAEQLLAQAKEQGVELVGPNGLLNQLTKNVLETALDAEMTEHLGYDKHDAAGRGSGNSRNGTRSKTVFTEIGPVEIEVPRDTNSSFEPQIVRKRQRRLTGIDQIVLSLTAKGLTTGEIAAHFDDVYGATVSKDTISRITDKVVEEMTEWCNRPLESVYPVVFIDAIHVKVRDGQVTNRPIYVAIGVTCAGERDILGLWAGDGGEGAKYWLAVLTEIRNRGINDVCIVVCDGLKGLPEAITTVWPRHRPDVRYSLPRHPDYADISGVCAGRAGAGRQNVGIISEGFQERDELVGRPVSAGGGRGRCGPVERLLFEFEIGFEINPCGGDVFVSKPQSDDGGVDAGMEQSHGGGVAKHVRCDVFARQGRARRGGGGGVDRDALGEGVESGDGCGTWRPRLSTARGHYEEPPTGLLRWCRPTVGRGGTPRGSANRWLP